jgi:hypothetical protein
MLAEPEPLADQLIRAVELLAEVFAAKGIRYALVGALLRVAKAEGSRTRQTSKRC